MPYRLFADFVLLLHLAVVVFIIGGLVLTWVGHFRGWRWISTWRFRLVHLAAIMFVVAEAWLGIICPLTSLEIWLRASAGQASSEITIERGFIQHWVQAILFYDFEPWVFTLAYTLFAAVVVATWWKIPPQKA